MFKVLDFIELQNENADDWIFFYNESFLLSAEFM